LYSFHLSPLIPIFITIISKHISFKKLFVWSVLLLSSSITFAQNDSVSKLTTFIKATFPQGSITAGYDYGLLPFLVQVNPPPQGNFKTHGNFTIQAKSLPFNASFFYSSVGTISGLNNYFRIQFDAQRYQQHLKEKFLQSQLDKVRST
jgi:hypothetical protein